MGKIPVHVAIIMDGNRRWAAGKNLPANKGHEAGALVLEPIVRAAVTFGIKYLTVFVLSTENLKSRGRLELFFLFSLLEKVIREKIPALNKNGVRLNLIGDLSGLPTSLRIRLNESKEKLAANKRLTLTLAVNYGGREEIVRAVRKTRKETSPFQEEDITANLDTAGLPDPDLIIRTGGQARLSNFLLWQASYAELYFTPTLWPDFSEKEFGKALEEYSLRIRNFGR